MILKNQNKNRYQYNKNKLNSKKSNKIWKIISNKLVMILKKLIMKTVAVVELIIFHNKMMFRINKKICNNNQMMKNSNILLMKISISNKFYKEKTIKKNKRNQIWNQKNQIDR